MRSRYYTRYAVISVLLAVLIVACADDEDVIGVYRPVYDDERAVLELHHFSTPSLAERFYEQQGISDYLLLVSPARTAESVFEQIDGDEIDGEGKRLEFAADGDESAIDRTIEFIEDNSLFNMDHI